MKIYRNDATDPYFNLAAEEYLMNTETEDVFMLWRNAPAVIIGRNQNAYAEIDRAFIAEHNIPVVRRLTGGGAVFHDLGNLCFTFIVDHKKCPEMDFSRFCMPILSVLRELGIKAELSGRNDMIVEGRKFSGNAETVYNGKVLHHGTILIAADLSHLAGALRVDEEKMRSKGIKSVRSRVCNLTEFLPMLTAADLMDRLFRHLGGDVIAFNDAQIEAIQALVRDKYATWEWNYSVSKEYGTTVKRRFPYGTVEVAYSLNHGVLTEVSFSGDYFGKRDIAELAHALVGCSLNQESMLPLLSDVSSYIHGAEPEDILQLFLS